MATAREQFAQEIVAALAPDPQITIVDWAEDNRVLPPSSPEPGLYRAARTPYVYDIQRTMSPGSGYVEGWWKKGVQIGGSTSGENFIGHAIDTAPGNALVVFPSLPEGKQWNEDRFGPLRAGCKSLRRKIRSASKRGSGNTVLRKRFPGGLLRIVGANRVPSIKATSYRYIKFEEVDEYPFQIGEQGSTVGIAKRRAANFGYRARIFGDSTPTIEGASEIDANYKRGDQRGWYLCCPDCGHAQVLEWERFGWDEGMPETVRYACIACTYKGREHEWKVRNYAREPSWTEEECARNGVAHWLPRAVGEKRVASWHLPSWNAPLGWRPWDQICREYIAAQGNEVLLKDWTNNQAAACWSTTVKATLDADTLRQRAEAYDLMFIPRGGLVLVAGVDTQDDRLAIVIRAYGRDEESWGIYHGELYGSPSAPETWAKLEALLSAPIRHASGQILRIDAAAIDSGGHHTEDVYAFCRNAQLQGKHWFAIKGAKFIDAPALGKPRPMEFTYRGKPVPGGVQLRFVGTQAIKNLLDGRLRSITRHGGGFVHFPLGFEADYFKQLRAEKQQWQKEKKTGHKALWWIKTDARNEAWDCEVYAYAAFLYAVSGRGGADAVFALRERLLGLVAQAELQLNVAPPSHADTTAPDSDSSESDETEAQPELVQTPTLAPPVISRAVARANQRRLRGSIIR